MKRFLVLSLMIVLTVIVVGCNSNDTPPPTENPNLDNRPAEIKEADDAMQKAMQEKMKHR